METLHSFLNRYFKNSDANEHDNFVVEGINVNNREKIVSLTDKHNKGVDLSLVNNPVYRKLGGHDVISIFKRTKLKNGKKWDQDGNPFIYALKEKYGWKFDITNEEISKYLKRFLKICDKIKNHYDTIIMVPSSSDLNKRFMEAISKQVHAKNIIPNYFLKVEKEKIINLNLIDEEQIRKDFGNQSEDILDKIHTHIEESDGDYLEAKTFGKDKYLLKYIKYILPGNSENIRDKIDGKDVLILDDTISSYSTISQCVKNIDDTFLPKSLTVITLLSGLKKRP